MKIKDVKVDECFFTVENIEKEIRVVFYLRVSGISVYPNNVNIKRLWIMQDKPDFQYEDGVFINASPRYFKIVEEEKAVLSETDGRADCFQNIWENEKSDQFFNFAVRYNEKIRSDIQKYKED